MNTKPRGEVACRDRLREQHEHQTQGEVACRDRLREQHEHQTQGRGSMQRQTQRAT